MKARQAKTRKVVTVTLCKVGLIPKAEVRVLAQEAIAALSKGENPNEKRKEEQRVAEKTWLVQNARRVTLAQVLEDYLSLKTLNLALSVTTDKRLIETLQIGLIDPFEISHEMMC